MSLNVLNNNSVPEVAQRPLNDKAIEVVEPPPLSLDLKAGDWVIVRSKAEILSTLDRNGRLDDLPFMPQMLQYCGKKLQVSKRAHKLCDTAHGTGARGMSNAVFLEDVRCDGQAYGGCEMRCLVFWKEAWLKRADESERVDASPVGSPGGCSEDDVWAGTHGAPIASAPNDPVYVCQATQLIQASHRLPRWAVKQYLEDYTSRNVGLRQLIASLSFLVYSNIAESGLGFGTLLRAMYDLFQRMRGGHPYPCRRGHLPKDSLTPKGKLNLEVGELVRIKEHEQILNTVKDTLQNRGMSFHPEMVPYCGKTFRVRQRAGRIMNERTGQIMALKNDCLVLDGVDCLGKYTTPLFCPRACYPYWREVWLERVEPNGTAAPTSTAGAIAEQTNKN